MGACSRRKFIQTACLASDLSYAVIHKKTAPIFLCAPRVAEYNNLKTRSIFHLFPMYDLCKFFPREGEPLPYDVKNEKKVCLSRSSSHATHTKNRCLLHRLFYFCASSISRSIVHLTACVLFPTIVSSTARFPTSITIFSARVTAV